METVGLFDLFNAPNQQAVDEVGAAIDEVAASYPIARVIPSLRAKGILHVPVEFVPSMAGLGDYRHAARSIRLTTQFTDQAKWQTRWTMAHEIGHLVDYCTLDHQDQQALIAELHTRPMANHDQPDYAHDPDRWRSIGDTTAYGARYSEAFADAFVWAFAPASLPDYMIRQGNQRMVHQSSDRDRFRNLCLRRPIVIFSDVPQDHPHREGIEWAAGQGIVTGKADGTFGAEEGVTRGQLCTILHRQHEQS